MDFPDETPPRHYVLNANGEPVPEPNILKWGIFFESANRIIKQETIGESLISTVSLGLDHAFSGPTPILWETMVFGGHLDQEQDRSSGSREQAEAMHARTVERVTAFVL
jgi:hypothetical protein